MEPVGATVARADRHRHHDPRLHGLGCLIYAVVGTFLANLVGRRLIPLNFQRQRFEANFRFSLVRVRENAEGIALYRGEEREAETLNERFADVFANGWRVLFTQAQLALYQVSYGQIAIIFPYIVTAPGFFAGAITLGVVMQTASAFGQVRARCRSSSTTTPISPSCAR